MAENPIGVRPDENPRQGAGGRTEREVNERQRALETTRDADKRRSSVARRTPMFGTTSSPLSLMRRMADDIERLFSNFDYGRVGYGLNDPPRYSSGMESWRSGNRMLEATWAPQLETFRKDGRLVLRADLPGLSKDTNGLPATPRLRSDAVRPHQAGLHRAGGRTTPRPVDRTGSLTGPECSRALSRLPIPAGMAGSTAAHPTRQRPRTAATPGGSGHP